EPLGVRRVAMETATELVVETAARHRVERLLDHRADPLVLRAAREEERQRERARELRSRAEARVVLVECGAELLERVDERLGGQLPSAALRRRARATQRLRDLRRARLDVRAPRPPDLVETLQERREPGT